MNNFSSPLDIPSFLEKLKDIGSRKPWVHRGELLEHIRREFIPWPIRGAYTFGRTVDAFAEGIGISSVMLWREMKAVNYYNHRLSKQLENGGCPAPPIDELPDHVSVGHLDLLERISLIMSDSAFLALAIRLIHPKDDQDRISRADLERRWEALKVTAPKLPRGRQRKEFVVEEALRVEGRIVAALVDSDLLWPKREVPHIYQVFPGGRDLSISLPGHTKTYTPDAVVVVATDKSADLTIHGIEVKHHLKFTGSSETRRRIEFKFVEAATSFDYFWLAMPSDTLRIAMGLPTEGPYVVGEENYARLRIPFSIGLLGLEKDGRLECIRNALRWEDVHPDRDDLQSMTHTAQVGAISKRLLARRLVSRRPRPERDA